MGRVVKKSVEKIVLNKKKFLLGMKGEFKIEFANDSFGPYKYKFEREDCYFIDALEDRGSSLFPLKAKKFNNTEIFLETDDIVVAVGERGSLKGGKKSFIDIINVKTEKKYRLFTSEVSLIYNTKDSIVINAKDGKAFNTIVLDIKTLEKKLEKKENLYPFFKVVYNQTEKKWFALDFFVGDEREGDEEKRYKKGYFNLKEIKNLGVPKNFLRKKFILETKSGRVDIWKQSNS